MQTKEYWKKYSQEHAVERRDKARNYYKSIKDKIFLLLGGKCVKCGFSDMRALQIDHVNGGGNMESRELRWSKYKVILEKVSGGSCDYQILCANCNWIKRAERGEHRKVA